MSFTSAIGVDAVIHEGTRINIGRIQALKGVPVNRRGCGFQLQPPFLVLCRKKTSLTYEGAFTIVPLQANTPCYPSERIYNL
jgi:hypothetical protein